MRLYPQREALTETTERLRLGDMTRVPIVVVATERNATGLRVGTATAKLA